MEFHLTTQQQLKNMRRAQLGEIFEFDRSTLQSDGAGQ
jgi:hypothetical protein